MNIIIDKNFEQDLFNEFTEEVNKALGLKAEWVDIYLDSVGGREDIAWAMAEMTTELATKIPVRIIAHSAVMSSAFTYLMTSVCGKKALRGCVGMFHKGFFDVNLYDGKVLGQLGKFKSVLSKERDIYNKKELKRLGVTKKELKAYKKNEDVYLTHGRMIEILKNDKNNTDSYASEDISHNRSSTF